MGALGVGSAFLNRIIQIAKECRYEQMELDVVSGNVYGIKLYENVGFVKTGMIPNAFKMKNGNVYNFNLLVLN